MISKRVLTYVLVGAAALLLLASVGMAAAQGPTPEEQLGKLLFFDKNLSEPQGQACAVCHGPEVGYTGPDSTINATGAVYEGAVYGRFGNRKPPAAAYAGDSPILHRGSDKVWVGGMFWDGRATGERLGDPLAEQAQGPFLNPLEQNNPSAKAVVDKVLNSNYASLFQDVCGPTYDVVAYYECIARSIAAYERSPEVSAFTSKYDYWLNGEATLTPEEETGLQLFEGKAMCSACHVPPLFTDFTYDNLGVPKNPLNPFYYERDWNPAGLRWVDYGLGGFLKNAGYPPNVYKSELGKFKVPTLRNVDKRPSSDFVKAFAHNGYFKSLEAIVHFYNTRDTLPTCAPKSRLVPGVDCWPASEVPQTINRTELGKLGLTPDEEAAIVAFLKTLTDGYVP